MSDGDDSAKFHPKATVNLAGTLDSSGLDVITTGASVINAEGHTWTVHGAFSRFAGGTTLKNSDHLTLTGGTVIVDDSADTFVNKGTVSVTGGHVRANASSAPAPSCRAVAPTCPARQVAHRAVPR
jgi:hypothetical protein